jgi:hypothetical protein
MDQAATVKKVEAAKVKAIKTYEPTPEEQAARKVFRERKNRTPRVKATPKPPGIELSVEHPDQQIGWTVLMRALATDDRDFLSEIVTELGRACADSKTVNEQRVNFMVAVIKGIEPRDQIETMLAAQMATIHSLTMDFASRLANAGALAWRDSAERTLNKLARTFAAQVETLKRYRSSGEQTVRVEHVTVNSGGQAVVGNVSHTPVGVSEKKEN